MLKQKSFFSYVAEMLDQYRTDRLQQQAKEPSRPRFRLERWLPTPGNIIFTLLVVGLMIMTQGVWALPNLAAVPGASATTINYQGRLSDNGGNPLSGTYNLDFAIYDAASDGNLMWGPESHTNIAVSDALFNVGLGSQTAGGIPTTTWDGDRYLEITVNGETLAPRELIRSVPIAGMALTVPDGAIGTEQLADGAVETAKIAEGAVETAKIADGAVGTEKIADRAVTQEKAPSLIRSLNGDDFTVQSGIVTKFTAGAVSEQVEVTFPVEFSEQPIVIISNCTLSNQQNWNSVDWMVMGQLVSPTGFTATYSLPNLSAGTYKGCWIAIGK